MATSIRYKQVWLGLSHPYPLFYWSSLFEQSTTVSSGTSGMSPTSAEPKPLSGSGSPREAIQAQSTKSWALSGTSFSACSAAVLCSAVSGAVIDTHLVSGGYKP